MLTANPVSWLRCAWLTGRLARHLTNWTDVTSRYLTGRPLPQLRLRSGIILNHSKFDAPVILLLEVFADGVYRRYLQPPMRGTVIDVGGNIGAAAIDLASTFDDVVIHTYEPNPGARAVLHQNIAANRLQSRISVFEEAVGRQEGRMPLWVNGPSLASTAYVSASPAGCTPVDVPVIDLNLCLRRVERQPVALLKIDAEGAEVDILEGVDVRQLANVRHIALEYHNDLYPRADERCRTVIHNAGFRSTTVPDGPSRGLLYGWRE